jgi:hypothetical protein
MPGGSWVAVAGITGYQWDATISIDLFDRGSSRLLRFHGEDTPQIYVFFEVPDLEQAIALVQEAGGEWVAQGYS